MQISPIDLSAEPTADEVAARRLAALRRRMMIQIMVVTLLGIATLITLIAVGKYRTVYKEHFEFRQYCKTSNLTEDMVLLKFGEPYRIYWSHESIAPVFDGKGLFHKFDGGVKDASSLPPAFMKVLHYRTTVEHGEFVFIASDKSVIRVVTGHRRPEPK